MFLFSREKIKHSELKQIPQFNLFSNFFCNEMQACYHCSQVGHIFQELNSCLYIVVARGSLAHCKMYFCYIDIQWPGRSGLVFTLSASILNLVCAD